ncbi:hypothetical protein [Pseudomonas aeruginosa]|uniref:hypothetical protein n=1 Tax=Pseudomonas aeruginosa TaxID=287 RepID=UPI00053EEB11|nr:hypothetical protein [Pseudomonas aeruginosa]
METDIPEILSDLRIGADAWSGVQEPVAHALTHDDIQNAVAEYLAAGGVITNIPAGVSSNQPVTFNSRITGSSTGMEREQQKRVQAKRTAKDIEYCQMLEDLVILDCGRWEIGPAMGISDHTVQRLLRTYFSTRTEFDKCRASGHGKSTLINGEKPCSKCKTLKPLSEYYSNPSKKDGHCSECKACENARRRAANAKQAA